MRPDLDGDVAEVSQITGNTGNKARRSVKTNVSLVYVYTDGCKNFTRTGSERIEIRIAVPWGLLADVAQQQDDTDTYQATDDDGVSPSSRLDHTQKVFNARHGAKHSCHSSVDAGDRRPLTRKVCPSLVCLSVQ